MKREIPKHKAQFMREKGVTMENQKPAPSIRAEENYRPSSRRHLSGISGIGAGLLLVLLGILLVLAAQDILSWDKWWQFFIIGVGIILLADSLLYRRRDVNEFRIGRLVTGIILIGVGIAFLLGNVAWWPVIIIVVGVAVITGSLLRKGRERAE
jgi:hypothetical protein